MRKLNVNKSTVMSRSQKSIPQPKKVAPPSVPEMYSMNRYSSGTNGPTSPSSSSNDEINFKRHLMEPISPSMVSSGYQRTSRIDPISHKAAVYFHQQYGLQEDQGIDLTQSPGRDSPGSSSGSAGSGSRHSTVSLDSGRSSSYLTGSVDRMNHQSDHDMIVNWLMMLNSDEYLPYAGNFSAAGYDLGTIARMTPEDLTAIGITNPHHREVIKAHIDELQINDNLPHFVPGSIEEWLRLLRLDEYIVQLQNEGFQSVRDVTKLNEEDLEDIGIVKLGHQKKILLAIKRLKEIVNGKSVVPCINYCCQPPTNNMMTSAGGAIFQQHHEDLQMHLAAKAGFFDPRIIPEHQPLPAYNPTIQTTYQQPASLPHSINWRRSYDDGDLTPTNEIMEAKNDASSGGGTLPRQQRQVKRERSNAARIDLPTPLQLFNTDYNEEARKQMSMYYNSISPSSSDQDGRAVFRRQSGSSIESDLCQKVEKCYIDGNAVHYGRASVPNAHFPAPFHPQMIYQHQMMHPGNPGNFQGRLYAGQMHQTQAEVHVEHNQAEVCMSNSSIDSIDQIPFANENAGTIKNRQLNREIPQSASSSSTSSSNSSASTAIPLCSSSARVTSPATTDCDSNNLEDPETVFNDINNMLNKLNGEIDIMIDQHEASTNEEA